MIKGKILRTEIIFPLLIGLFLVYYSFKDTSIEEQKVIIESIKNTDYKFILFSMLIGLISHLLRAKRWQILISPLGFNLQLHNSIMTIFAGLLSNFGIPRSGEFLRASLVYYYERIPFEKNLGTIVAERIIDVFILAMLVFVGVNSFDFLNVDKDFNLVKISIYILLLLCFFVFIWGKLKYSFKNKIHRHILNIKEGILSVFKIEKKLNFFIYTFTIWISYFLMLYIAKFSIAETFFLPIEAIFFSFVAGAIAMTLTNGGLGAYPLAISSVITQYEVPYESAITFGWVVWTSQTLIVVIFGCLSFIFLPILNKNNKLK